MVNKEDFKKEVLRIADIMKVTPSQIQIRHMKKKVGSCTPSKTVVFDYAVLDYSHPRRIEVIVHELLHLRYMNHGKIFKLLLKEYVSEPMNNVFY